MCGKGTGLASVGVGGRLSFWRRSDAGWQKQAVGSEADSQPVIEAIMSPDCSWLVAVGADGAARLWRTDGRLWFASNLPEARGHARKVAFAHNSNRLLIGAEDGTVHVWALEGRVKLVGVLHGHRAAVTAAAFSPDDERILTASKDGTARMWWRPTPAMGWRSAVVAGHDRPIDVASFSGDGRWIVTGSEDSTALLTAVAVTGDGVEMTGHPGWIRHHSLCAQQPVCGDGRAEGQRTRVVLRRRRVGHPAGGAR